MTSNEILARLRRHCVAREVVNAVADVCQREVAWVRAFERSGLDVAPCSLCGLPVVCVPEGGALCKECAERVEVREPKQEGDDR